MRHRLSFTRNRNGACNEPVMFPCALRQDKVEECLVQLGYCIGLVDPVSVMVNSYETGKLSDEALSKLVRKVFPLSPHGSRLPRCGAY